MTHISYECAKRLKEFLGESAPEPIIQIWWDAHPPNVERLIGPDVREYGSTFFKDNGNWRRLMKEHNLPPAYQLHDLLSKPFCEACAEHHPHKEDMGPLKEVAWELAIMITELFYSGGLPAVEKALTKMMEEK